MHRLQSVPVCLLQSDVSFCGNGQVSALDIETNKKLVANNDMNSVFIILALFI